MVTVAVSERVKRLVVATPSSVTVNVNTISPAVLVEATVNESVDNVLSSRVMGVLVVLDVSTHAYDAIMPSSVLAVPVSITIPPVFTAVELPAVLATGAALSVMIFALATIESLPLPSVTTIAKV